eukprot:gene9977-biopygen90
MHDPGERSVRLREEIHLLRVAKGSAARRHGGDGVPRSAKHAVSPTRSAPRVTIGVTAGRGAPNTQSAPHGQPLAADCLGLRLRRLRRHADVSFCVRLVPPAEGISYGLRR